MEFNRYLHPAVNEWLDHRMVFIGGPRQVGKTYLAKSFMSEKSLYLTWDDLGDRTLLKQHQLPGPADLMILDEIHKYFRWRTLVKGLYDKRRRAQKFIVTGSAQLDKFRKGGDSLFGRYHYLRLHPLSLPELKSNGSKSGSKELLKFGGFPEPFARQSESFSKIWRRERTARIIQQDLRDLTQLKDYSALEVLADLLPDRVGSLLSIKSLSEDLECSPHTIDSWIQILESVYHCFRVPPFGPPRVKAIKKANKLFLWDWSAVEKTGAQFENFVASHLLKFCHYREDVNGEKMELRFLRDQFDREIDFVVLQNKKPIFAVECKHGEGAASPHMRYFSERTNIPKFYQVHLGTKDYGSEKTGRVLPFSTFCKEEGLV